MSQIENTRPRSGQIVRPAAFQPGQRDAPVDPAYGVPGPPYGQDCDRHMCGCGSAYCGPGQEFCWYCMKQMMVKEIACLLKTDPELQAILNAPKMGITDGSAQIPGQVGEYIGGTGSVNVPALPSGNTVLYCSPLVVPPGEWLLTSFGWGGTIWQTIGMTVNPMPPGLTTDLAANLYTPTGDIEAVMVGTSALGNFTVPTLLPFECWFGAAPGGSSAATFNVTVQGWRVR